VIPTVKQSGIRVNAISLGTEAIEGVEMISLETGGTNSFATSAQEHFLLLFSHWLTLIILTLCQIMENSSRNFHFLGHEPDSFTEKQFSENSSIKKS